jgi:hypothetical protein
LLRRAARRRSARDAVDSLASSLLELAASALGSSAFTGSDFTLSDFASARRESDFARRRSLGSGAATISSFAETF